MMSMHRQRLLALFVALVLIPGLFGCARIAEPGEPAAAIDSALAQAATLSTRKADTTNADTTNEDRTETDTTWNCPPEVDGPIISLRPDTSQRYGHKPNFVMPAHGDFRGKSAAIGWTKDINADGQNDIRLRFMGYGGAWGELYYAVYVGCRSSHYARVWGPDYAFKLETGDPDTVAGNWMPIRAFSREGEEFAYIFSDGTYVRKR